jgi:lipoic acid synthetase
MADNLLAKEKGTGLHSPKPSWLRVPAPWGVEVMRMKERLRSHDLRTVCEEASCPNLGTCFREGVATVMILGRVCTRACPFCDVDHGKPFSPDSEEPQRIVRLVREAGLRFLVVTSVDRDDLSDGGAAHFVSVVKALRSDLPSVGIEILVPDFRHSLERSLDILKDIRIDVFNHNLETVPSLYPRVRPGADYRHSLTLLSRFAASQPEVPVKSGLMVGLGESREEIRSVMKDMKNAGVSMVTIGQYLAPSRNHLGVVRYLPPDEFEEIGMEARTTGFRVVESGPLVRSSYHAEKLLDPDGRSIN